MKWQDVTVLHIEESHVLQLHADVVDVARSLLNETMLGDNRLHLKAQPALLKHAGWYQCKELLRLALSNFEMTIRLPGRSNCTVSKPRYKRSFLRLSKVADTAHLEERIQVLQATENRAIKTTNFLRSKLLKGADLMSAYIRDGELKKKEMSRSLIHLQMEVAVLMMLRAAEDATHELNALTDSVLKGKLSDVILSNLHYGDLLAITFKNNKIPVLSFAVSSLKPMKFNCTKINHNHLCKLPGDDYVTNSKFGFDQPAVTHASAYYSTIFDALNANVKEDFPSCLEKKIGLNLTWRYFLLGC